MIITLTITTLYELVNQHYFRRCKGYFIPTFYSACQVFKAGALLDSSSQNQLYHSHCNSSNNKPIYKQIKMFSPNSLTQLGNLITKLEKSCLLNFKYYSKSQTISSSPIVISHFLSTLVFALFTSSQFIFIPYQLKSEIRKESPNLVVLFWLIILFIGYTLAVSSLISAAANADLMCQQFKQNIILNNILSSKSEQTSFIIHKT